MPQRLMGRGILLAVLVGWAAVLGPAAADDRKDDDKGWVQLFNGKDLEGWKTHPADKAVWKVEDGVLIGTGKHVGHLYTKRGDYANFRYRVEAKINDGGNS